MKKPRKRTDKGEKIVPDITMCQNESCHLRVSCYRFMAEPTPGRQSYAYFEPFASECDYFIPIKEVE